MSRSGVLTVLAALWGALLPATGWAQKPRGPVTLARSVPADARLFLELRDLQSFLNTRSGREFTELLAGLIPSPTTRPATQPALTWQQVLGEKLGLPNAKAAELLFTGRLALAADAWRSIDDAVLLSQPVDPAALESQLQALRIPAPPQAKVRRYQLASGHELACDGRTVVTGRFGGPTRLYVRTVALWLNDRPVSLFDLADYRERITALPVESHIVFYTGPGGVPPSTMPSGDLSMLWPDIHSAAVGVVMNGTAVTVETSAKLARDTAPARPSDPPIDSLLRVPDSTLVAWTSPIRYADDFKRIEAASPEGMIRFYLDVFQAGLPAGTLESSLLRHLVGDTILMIGQEPMPVQPGDPPSEPLLLPVMAMAVETDDPDAVSAVLPHMAGNLLRLLNLQPLPGGPLTVRETPLEPGGPVIRSVSLGRFFAPYTACEFLRSLDISWVVADRWLVVATHSETVRQIVEVRRGGGRPMAATGIQQALARVRGKKGTPQITLIARPEAAGNMIVSWIRYIDRHHHDMLAPDWWERLRRRQLAEGVQLGIVPRTTTQPGVLVDRTLPGWPAHNRLKAGDRILSVDGRAVDQKRPGLSLRELMANRQKPDNVMLKVARAGQETVVSVPMPAGLISGPPIQPFAVLADLADLLRVFSSASFVSWQPARDLVNARLELELADPTTMPASNLAKVRPPGNPRFMLQPTAPPPGTAPAPMALTTRPAQPPTTAPAMAAPRAPSTTTAPTPAVPASHAPVAVPAPVTHTRPATTPAPVAPARPGSRTVPASAPAPTTAPR